MKTIVAWLVVMAITLYADCHTVVVCPADGSDCTIQIVCID